MKTNIPDHKFGRRGFLQAGTAAAAAAMVPRATLGAAPAAADLPAGFSALKPLGSCVHPITPDEFRARLARAQQLMTDAKPRFDGLYVTMGTSLYYFTGIRWGLSERVVALLLPRSGDSILICPGFEEGRLREQLRFPIEIRVWQEDESPARLAADVFAARGVKSGRIAIEETTRFTFYDHVRQAAPALECVSADPITIGCRGRKSPQELALMRLACEATFDVFRAAFGSLREGLSQDEISQWVEAGFAKMGQRGGALVLIGESAALPHGTVKPRKLREGDVVLIDGGTSVDGYASDVTRTGIFGKASPKIQRAFEIVRKAQDAALDAARAGKLSGSVDDAARAVITAAGYGPDYKFFPHRLGHGMGLDGHEHPYLVRGSKTVLEPGMTFSNEPGIYIPGEFGMRCEDDMVIAGEGPAQLLTPGFAPSLETPIA